MGNDQANNQDSYTVYMLEAVKLQRNHHNKTFSNLLSHIHAYVTGFAKTRHNPARTEIHFIA